MCLRVLKSYNKTVNSLGELARTHTDALKQKTHLSVNGRKEILTDQCSGGYAHTYQRKKTEKKHTTHTHTHSFSN